MTTERKFVVMGLVTVALVIGGFYLVYWLGQQSVKHEVRDRVAAVKESERRSRVATCRRGNKKLAQQRDTLLTLTPVPRYQDAINKAFGPVDCQVLQGT